MNSIEQQMRERSIEADAAVTGLKVYKGRLADNSGWYFITAPSLIAARKYLAHMNIELVVHASHADLVRLACRALTGR